MNADSRHDSKRATRARKWQPVATGARRAGCGRADGGASWRWAVVNPQGGIPAIEPHESPHIALPENKITTHRPLWIQGKW